MVTRAKRDLDDTTQIDVSRLSFSAKLGVSLLAGFITLVMPIASMLYTIKVEQHDQARAVEYNQALTTKQLDTIRDNIKDNKEAVAQTLNDHTRQLNYLNATMQEVEVALAKSGKSLK